MKWKSKIITGNLIKESGWGIIKITIDTVYSMYLCETLQYIEPNKSYDYDLFADVSAEFPIYFFTTFDQALAFAKKVSNRYPYDRAMYWLRFQPEYWFSTVAIQYIDYVNYINELRRDYALQHRIKK